MMLAKRAGPLMLPAHITVEPTNVCNARCPVCETGNRTMERSSGFLKHRDFRKIIDEVHPTTAVLMFYFMGEPFLNADAYDMIRYARERNIYVETCTNGDFVDAKGVIYSDINQISFQIGGMTNASHQIYRVRSDLERVRKNIESLVEARRSNPASNVQVEVGFIVMKHNEHEVESFTRWCQELGVDKANIIDPCVRNVEEGLQYLTQDPKYWYYDRDAFEKGVLRPKIVPDNECTWVWNSAVINWDGSMVPCCRDPHGRHVFGNVLERGFKSIWNGDEARRFRRSILRTQDEIDICRLCSGYGLPNLGRGPQVNFEVVRHTVDEAYLADLQKDALDFGVPVDMPTFRRRKA
jgi:radical SAM protein with 4Fe4S-binding SPASM domain